MLYREHYGRSFGRERMRWWSWWYRHMMGRACFRSYWVSALRSERCLASRHTSAVRVSAPRGVCISDHPRTAVVPYCVERQGILRTGLRTPD